MKVFRIWLLIAALFASSVVCADMFQAQKGPNGEIVLSDNTCVQMRDAIQAIRSWTESLGESVGPMPEIDASCRADITHSVPTQVRNEQDTITAFNGPNCWNTALRSKGLVQKIRFSAEGEMTFWMNSPYCHQLRDNELAEPGDIVAIRTYDGDQPSELHGMIYLTPDLVYSKNTSSYDDPYGIQRVDLIDQDYNLVGCPKIYGTNPKCWTWANYYRCANPSPDRALALTGDANLAANTQALALIESDVSQFVLTGAPSSWNIPDIRSVQIAKIASSAQTAIQALMPNKTPQEQRRLFFWRALHEEVLSLQAQLRMIQAQRQSGDKPNQKGGFEIALKFKPASSQQ